MVTKFAREIARAARPILGWRAMTLVRVEPGPRGAVLTAGTSLVTTSHRCRGRKGARRRLFEEPALGQTRGREVYFSLLGATLPDGIEPRAGDRIVCDGATFTIANDGAINDDGLGAVWECMTRAGG